MNIVTQNCSSRSSGREALAISPSICFFLLTRQAGSSELISSPIKWSLEGPGSLIWTWRHFLHYFNGNTLQILSWFVNHVPKCQKNPIFLSTITRKLGTFLYFLSLLRIQLVSDKVFSQKNWRFSLRTKHAMHLSTGNQHWKTSKQTTSLLPTNKFHWFSLTFSTLTILLLCSLLIVSIGIFVYETQQRNLKFCSWCRRDFCLFCSAIINNAKDYNVTVAPDTNQIWNLVFNVRTKSVKCTSHVGNTVKIFPSFLFVLN